MNLYRWMGLILLLLVIGVNLGFVLSGYYFDSFSWGFLSGAGAIGGLVQWLGVTE